MLPEGHAIEKITKLHTEITRGLKITIGKAIEIGELLTQQKKQMKHGEFTPWIKANLPFTERTARNYMRIFQERELLKTEMIADLTGAYKLLTAPKSTKADLELLRQDLELLRQNLEAVDSIDDPNEQIKELARISRRARALEQKAAAETIRIERRLGKLLSEIKTKQNEFEKVSQWCRAWQKLFRERDKNPTQFDSQILSSGVNSENINEIYKMREDIFQFPRIYKEIRAIL